MTTALPPYRPFLGAEPPHFVDRPDDLAMSGQGLVSATVMACQRPPGGPGSHQLVVGAPGMGKTAFLRQLGRQVGGRLDWAVVLHHCSPKQQVPSSLARRALSSLCSSWPQFRSELAKAVLATRHGYGAPGWRHCCAQASCACVLHSARRRWPPAALGPCREAAQGWEDLYGTLHLAGEFAAARGRGVLVMLDDVDLMTGVEAEAMGYLARSLTRELLPVSLVMTGGQGLADRYERCTNFAGALWASRLAPFDHSEAREAIVVPAAERGVDIEEEAVDFLCSQSAGLPVEVQSAAFGAWSAARGGPVITLRHAQDAIARSASQVATRAS